MGSAQQTWPIATLNVCISMVLDPKNRSLLPSRNVSRAFQGWLKKSKTKEQEDFGSDEEQSQSKTANQRRNTKIKIVGHKPFSKLISTHLSCYLYFSYQVLKCK